MVSSVSSMLEVVSPTSSSEVVDVCSLGGSVVEAANVAVVASSLCPVVVAVAAVVATVSSPTTSIPGSLGPPSMDPPTASASSIEVGGTYSPGKKE